MRQSSKHEPCIANLRYLAEVVWLWKSDKRSDVSLLIRVLRLLFLLARRLAMDIRLEMQDCASLSAAVESRVISYIRTW